MQSKAIRAFKASLPTANNLSFVFLSLVGSALNYLLYPILAKIITPTQFGDVSVVIAMAGQIGGLLLAFNVVSIYIVVTYDQTHAAKITSIIQKILIQLLLVVTVVVLLASPWLMQLLKISSPATILGLGLLLLLNVPGVVWTGYLQGHNELRRVGVYNTAAAAAKLLVAVGLCVLGFGATGAVIGLLAGQIIGLWVIHSHQGVRLPSISGVGSRVTPIELSLVKPLAWYVGESLVVVGIYSILFAIDIVLAKGLFTPNLAGLYAGVAALGRVVFFGANILTWILLANLRPQDPSKSRATLVRYLGLIAGLGAIAIGGFWLYGSLIVRLSLGHLYVRMAPQLWLAGTNQLIASLLYAYTLYQLVLRRSHPSILAVLSCGLAAVGGVLLHENGPHGMLMGLIIGQLVGCVLYIMVVSGRKLMTGTSR